jgi:glycosyltransferase involved in cell wall biosynthesis
MFKTIEVHAEFNERTGFGIHSSRFFPALNKLTSQCKDGVGTVHISLLDVVTAAHTTVRHPAPSILYTVWESTEYPAEFMDKIKLYDQLWVPSEWAKACSVAQGIPEEFVKVVPEGVDPETYKPGQVSAAATPEIFSFLHVGQWQPRKSTLEIVQSFLRSFPKEQYENVRLYLSTDTLFPSDSYKSTEERLSAYGLTDPRIIPIHFEDRPAYITDSNRPTVLYRVAVRRDGDCRLSRPWHVEYQPLWQIIPALPNTPAMTLLQSEWPFPN